MLMFSPYRIVVTPPCLAMLGEGLMWKIFMAYFTECIVKNEVMWVTKKLLQRYADRICFMNLIVIEYGFYYNRFQHAMNFSTVSCAEEYVSFAILKNCSTIKHPLNPSLHQDL